MFCHLAFAVTASPITANPAAANKTAVDIGFLFAGGSFTQDGEFTTTLNRVAQFEVTLPVELTSFTARADGEAGRLDWHTATETHNAGFEVEIRNPQSPMRGGNPRAGSRAMARRPSPTPTRTGWPAWSRASTGFG